MKQRFELCIFVSDIKHLLNLQDTLEIVKKPSAEVSDILDTNLKANQASLTRLRDFMYKYEGLNFQDHIERIYYGQETCENLIPELSDVQKGLDYCIENEYGFTLVTPYVAPNGIKKIVKIFEFLNESDEEIEVVVNDFGVLQLILTSFTNLTPVFGRLLTKMKRDPRFSLSGYDISERELPNLKKVEKNQSKALQSAGLDLAEYQKFLKSKEITRIGLDSIPQGLDAGSLKKWGFDYDIYWPWTYITSGRNCSVAAYTQPGKSYHPTDEPCRFQCRQYEFTFDSDKKMLQSIERGNAVWMNAISRYEEFFKVAFCRLVYAPYVPV